MSDLPPLSIEPSAGRRPSPVARFAELDGELQRLLLNVADLVSSIGYGTVQIVLQDGEVMQLQTSEKIRLRCPRA
jgi:hypothetical protein